MKRISIILSAFAILALASCSSKESTDEAKTSQDSAALNNAADSMLNAASAEMQAGDTAAVADTSHSESSKKEEGEKSEKE